MQHPLAAPAQLYHTWALDFMTDRLYDDGAFRTLNVLDEGNREGPTIEISMSLPSLRVISVLDDLVSLHGATPVILVDNGTERTSIALTRRRAQRHAWVLHTQPRKPRQSAYYRTLQPQLSHRGPLCAHP